MLQNYRFSVGKREFYFKRMAGYQLFWVFAIVMDINIENNLNIIGEDD